MISLKLSGISLWMLIRESPFNLSWPIVFLRFVLSLCSTDIDLSHSHEVTGIVARRSAALIFGNEVLAGYIFFKVSPTDDGMLPLYSLGQ